MRQRLKIALVTSGRSQRQIARRVPMSEGRLSSIVRGWVEPREGERRALARVLETTVEELFGEGSEADRSALGAA